MITSNRHNLKYSLNIIDFKLNKKFKINNGKKYKFKKQ
jgi:hypothetical protein